LHFTEQQVHLSKCKGIRSKAKEQFGFRKNLTTEKATYELSNEILDALNKKLLVCGIFCDLAKAFDCVNHETLLLKLNWYGIKDNS
jgi:hypothetical protein